MIPLGIVMLIRSEKAGTLEQLGYTTLAIGILLIICFFEEVVNFFIPLGIYSVTDAYSVNIGARIIFYLVGIANVHGEGMTRQMVVVIVKQRLPSG